MHCTVLSGLRDSFQRHALHIPCLSIHLVFIHSASNHSAKPYLLHSAVGGVDCGFFCVQTFTDTLVFFSFVIFYIILSSFVLVISSLILSYSVFLTLSYFILSCPGLAWLVFSCLILPSLVQSCIVSFLSCLKFPSLNSPCLFSPLV